ncbi:hypothetical protein AB0J38_17380 [Streptomyces sp. NPDC050095]|uniref:hypothetical protein n=1 Tax=unclassified Streptomyces TaxID=2593676 RepID=UPI00342E1710
MSTHSTANSGRDRMLGNQVVHSLPPHDCGDPDCKMPYLPTPRASDGPHGGPNQRGSGGDYALSGAVVHLLPTPTARMAAGAARPDRRPPGQDDLQTRVARHLTPPGPLLKTPTANLGAGGAAQHPDKRKAGGHGPRLDDEAVFLLPYADGAHGEDAQESPAEWWGEYLHAIRRWEHLTGLAAPPPTEVGPRGGRRLAAPFAEWLMGLPRGFVTGLAGLSRSRQLKIIGNGVVWQQAYHAYAWLLAQPTDKENGT